MQIFSGHTNRVNDVAFSLDGRTLASCSTDGTVRVWDCLTGKGEVLYQVDTSRLNELWRVDFGVGGALLVQPRWRGLQAWDVVVRACVAQLVDDSAGMVHALAISSTGDRVAIEMREPAPNFYSHIILVWNTASWKQVGELRLGADYHTSGVAFDPSGTRLATSGGLFDSRTNSLISKVSFRGDTLAWSSNGKFVAGCHGKVVGVVNAETGNCVQEARIYLGGRKIQDFAFSPDSTRLAVVSNEATVRIWDTRTWEERPTLAWGVGKLKCIAFSPDGTRVACGSHNGTILVWDWDG